jgi:RNA polymerase sigma-70 factor (ECF subfamily)
VTRLEPNTVSGMATSDAVAPARPRREPDPESAAWLAALHACGSERDAAVGRLHGLLVRAAHFELGRRRAALTQIRGEEIDDLAMQAADDALMAILRKLDQYRGESRFTTWAYKFALLEASVKVRRRAWRDREIPLEPDAWARVADHALAPQAAVEGAELARCLRRAITERLTAHQRNVLVALAIDGVPVDVLAERLGTTRGALYKTLHDARRKLRAEMAAGGFAIQPQESGAP